MANVTAIKQIADVASITARYVHRDNFKDLTPEMEREIRDGMRDLDPDQRMNIFRTTPDPRVRAAIAAGPHAPGSFREDKTRRFEPFVDPDELASAQMELAEAADIGAATKMHSHLGVAEVFKLATGSVRREMEQIAGVTV